MTLIAFALVCFGTAIPASAALSDNFSPRPYREDEEVEVLANSMTSALGGLPLSPYSIRMCSPSKQELKQFKKSENIAQILLGDKLLPSTYRFTFLHNRTMEKLCSVSLREKDKKTLERRIDQQYRLNLNIDNLPVAERAAKNSLRKSNLPTVIKGCSLGFSAERKQSAESKLLYNHIDFVVEYSAAPVENRKVPFGPQPAPNYHIVGFFCTPRSHRGESFEGDSPLTLGIDAESITWTYSVAWQKSTKPWSTRWDFYLEGATTDARIQWLSLLSSLAVMIVLTLMVASILVRTVRRDLIDHEGFRLSLTDSFNEGGWKNLHGDVFRNPWRANMFAILIGSGTQVLAGSACTMLFATLGYLSPEYRGAFLTMFLIALIVLGYLNGFVTARFCKAFRIAKWSHILKSAVYLPGLTLLMYLPINIIQSYKSAANELSVSDTLVLIGCWLFVSAPLVFFGAVHAFRQRAVAFPCAVNPIPRPMPVRFGGYRSHGFLLLAGIVPFSAAFVALAYVLSSIWQGRLFSMFTFCGLALAIFCAVTAEVSIIVTYISLSNGNYRWWWPSFFSTASTGVYLFLYSAYYFITTLHIHQLSSMLTYYGYMFLLSVLLALCSGTIGFYASLYFVQYIFAHVRCD